MTFAAESAKAGRRPLVVVDLRLDACNNTYGVSPCTATGGSGAECYYCFGTCQDTPNFNRLADSTRLYLANREPRNVSGLPYDSGVSALQLLVPTVEDVKYQAAAITPGQGLGSLGKVTVQCRDFPGSWIDRFFDPHYLTRPARADSPFQPPGTWWGRLLARHRYYTGRPMHVYSGYDNSTFPDDFEHRVYVIDRIDGPDAKGKVTIIGKDPLKLADDRKATCPVTLSATLDADVTAAEVTSLTVTETDAAFDALLSLIRIDDEIIAYAYYTAGGFYGLSRGYGGTEAAAHEAGASVQAVKLIAEANVVDVVEDLLTNYTELPAAYISAPWLDVEGWLDGVFVGAIIAEPVGVMTLLRELADQCLFDLWWDERQQIVRLKAIAPSRPTVTLEEIDDTLNIVADTSVRKVDTGKRVTRVFMHYGMINPLDGEDAGNFSRLYVDLNGDAESENAYGSPSVKALKSRWLSEEHSATVTQMVSRLVGRLGNDPEQIRFGIDPKDGSLEVGEHVLITSRVFQGPDGNPLQFEARVRSIEPQKEGHLLLVEAVDLRFSTRYAYIAPNTQVDYASAASGQKLIYGFIAPASGNFADGGVPYRVI